MKKIEKAEYVRILKFVLFSISAGLVQTLSFTFLKEIIKASYWPAYLIALVLSVLWNFTANRKFTFKSANNIPVAMLKVALFYAVFTPLSTVGGNLLVKGGMNEYIVLFSTMIINFITEFLYQRIWVFGKSIDSAKK